MVNHMCGNVDDEVEKSGIKSVPLEAPDETLFVDGSWIYVNGLPGTGRAVVELRVVRERRIEGGLSAQLAALIQVIMEATGKRVNIYTDCRYVFGIVYDYLTVWGRQSFVTTGGTPVKHRQIIKTLLEASELLSVAAVLKVKAHQREPDKQNLELAHF
ncbi:ribonuclease H-like [Chiloscyllium punctatum]|uniref:ribonuclease H-like n=1 Tax=Chiloscyllium punctatum TaxID=137246 RepID=UPI003B634493